MSTDLGYFVRVPLRPASPAPDAAGVVLRLVRGSGPRLARTKAVLVALGGVCGGLLLYLVIELLSLFLSLWGSDDSGHRVFAVAMASIVAVCGLVSGPLIWRVWSRPTSITVLADEAIIRYPGFGRPFVVPRELVRVVTTDASPVKAFRNNKRFPVEGAVPEDVFADALDQFNKPPWEPRDANHPDATTGPTVPAPRWPQGGPAAGEGKPGYLFGDGGTALHVLRVNPEDVPNVAVLFHQPVKTPGAPIGFMLSMMCGLFPGGRRIRGFMARVEIAEDAAAAFGHWGVVRPVTAQDVVDEGLRLPKPLKGWRIPAYVAAIAIPFVIKTLLRIAT